MVAEGRNPLERFFNTVSFVVDGPVIWFRKTVVEPNQKKYPWYHQKLRRVPTLDECYKDDLVCRYEAQQQFRRDKLVESSVLHIMRQRFEDCVLYEAPDELNRCAGILEEYRQAEENWFSRYGDLGAYYDVKIALMKQKHRMIWERRHGKIGSGKTGSGNTPEQ